MGQKVNPIIIRLGHAEQARSVWYARGKEFPKKLLSDIKVREYITTKLAQAAVSRVEIKRPAQNARITIYTARPGIVIGKKGEDIEKIRQEVARMMGVPVQIDIQEIRKPELDAQLVADAIAQQLEKRVMFRRAMKRAVQTAIKMGAEGAKVCIAGRIGGAEIARTEWYREGRVPLHTFKAHIDYAISRASTTYGVLGIKVWICKGEVQALRGANVAPEKEARLSSEDKRGY